MNPLWRPRIVDDLKAVEGNFPPLIGKILSARGIATPDVAQKILNPKLLDLRDPYALDGMSQAVERMLEAFKNKEKICIYADFDLDGTSGLALFLRGLQALGFDHVVYYQPKRLSEGYGFHASAVEDLAQQGVSLIVTIDVGITAIAAVQKANELGLDVIITDHHLPAETLPPALVVVNPNKGSCSSGLNYLCGAGVAFYFLRALKRAIGNDPAFPQNDFDLKDVLDFFTIATVTDMVPLVEDNRVLVKHGLKKLSETQRPGLRALLEALDFSDRELTSQDVAIRFAPKLNALSRMEAGVLPIDIFLEESPEKAKDLVRFVLAQNSQRVKLQGNAEVKAMEILKDWPHKDFVFVVSDEFHRGVVGLIATKLSQVYNCPAFVGAQGEDGVVVGSARIPHGAEICLVEALSSGQDFLSRFGGHSAAAGFEFHLHRQNEIIQALSLHFKESREQPKPLEIVYDVEASIDDVNPQLMKWHDFVGPFGTGFQTPLMRFSNLLLLSKRELKGGHLRLRLAGKSDQNPVEGLLFTPTPRQLEILQGVSSGWVDVLGELQWNYFAGSKTIQLLIKDLKISEGRI